MAFYLFLTAAVVLFVVWWAVSRAAESAGESAVFLFHAGDDWADLHADRMVAKGAVPSGALILFAAVAAVAAAGASWWLVGVLWADAWTASDGRHFGIRFGHLAAIVALVVGSAAALMVWACFVVGRRRARRRLRARAGFGR